MNKDFIKKHELYLEGILNNCVKWKQLRSTQSRQTLRNMINKLGGLGPLLR